MRHTLVQSFTYALAGIDQQAADSYDRHRGEILSSVNAAIESRSDIEALTGPGPIDVLRTNHANHIEFISSIFRVKTAPVLVDVVLWVYRSYIERGFSPDYFPIEIQEFRNAIAKYLPPASAEPILLFYDLMQRSHEEFLSLSETSSICTTATTKARDQFDIYLGAVLRPSSAEAVAVTREFVYTPEDIRFWWQEVIQPVLYEVGRLWADGEVSVGQEHLASSISQRVMSIFYPIILEIPKDKGTIVFAASPGELHDIGPRMMSDFLEIWGWNVYYTGADTPADSVVDVIGRTGARFLCVSTTVPFNLLNTKRLVQTVRESYGDSVGILVGGQAYCIDPELWKQIGADAYAQTIEDAASFLESWQANE